MKLLLFYFLCINSINNNLISFVKIKEVSSDMIQMNEIKSEEGTYKYYEKKEDPKDIYMQNHLPFLIQSIYKIKTPIEYSTSNVKYYITPFKEIIMEADNQKICIGKYENCYATKHGYCQIFKGGDKCDLRKNIRRSAKVTYIGSKGPLKIEKVVEKQTCTYEFIVSGDILARKVSNKNIYYYLEKENV